MGDRVGRREWLDVAGGCVLVLVAVTTWHFPIRNLWTLTLDHLGETAPVLAIGISLIVLFHGFWMAGAAYVATRSLCHPVNVWKRLYPVSISVMVAAWVTTAIELVMLGRSPVTMPPAKEAADLLLLTNTAYSLLWIAAWVHLRHLRSETPREEPALWRRPGPWIYVGIWAVGLTLEYLV